MATIIQKMKLTLTMSWVWELMTTETVLQTTKSLMKTLRCGLMRRKRHDTHGIAISGGMVTSTTKMAMIDSEMFRDSPLYLCRAASDPGKTRPRFAILQSQKDLRLNNAIPPIPIFSQEGNISSRKKQKTLRKHQKHSYPTNACKANLSASWTRLLHFWHSLHNSQSDSQSVRA